ncbi:methylmalonyl-CoA mutase subunit beta [Aureibaculum sp. 2210JD6-5]|uniref:methylmalonyl-CoA mutase subunit beta n=1 Tax=Aureibaculum sp. 2210JD6-5 TaxID=3103957 RepID=UPI002AAE05E7|nr:methylmalonyl-CoA mutase subunit beta [Aureibaculum sp. 2210JD6-5]MDY7395377.1 methylmalonyl-CoA mutase subunit beta [Aureibaculum sp. 2210JD6-5]
MNDFLFNEFEPISSKQWKQKIQFDLKGADYNETLVWESNEGIKVKPFYHLDDVDFLNINSKKKQFSVCQSIFVSDGKTANFLAKDALKRGANAIEFEANEIFDVEQLLKGLYLTDDSKKILQIHFKLNFLSADFLTELIEKTSDFTIFLNTDIIGNLVKTGNWFKNNKEDHTVLENILKKATKNTNVLSVDAGLYQNAGANIVQQVAYALAHANEYLNANNDTVIQSESEESIQFNFSIGGNYFFEIAKLRAFQYLWEILTEEYDLNIKANLFAKPSLRNKTLYDYNVNMLRTTTECMSAILGGADVISNVSYDSLYHKKNEFAERIARNQLLILQEESYFKQANQFADGSYYIESLTKQFAEKALELFKDIEKNGGFLKQLQAGTIQRKIEESATKEQQQFDNGEIVLLGTNKHPNIDDKMKSELELYPFVKTKPRKTTIKPVIAKRLAEKLEQERLSKE